MAGNGSVVAGPARGGELGRGPAVVDLSDRILADLTDRDEA
jgi:hypothetical protein